MEKENILGIIVVLLSVCGVTAFVSTILLIWTDIDYKILLKLIATCILFGWLLYCAGDAIDSQE